MKKIKAKFNSRCAETGKRIAKGEDMYYNYATKKCYCMSSHEAQHIEGINDGFKPMTNEIDGEFPRVSDDSHNDAHYVAAQEDAYWDNLTGGYYSR